MQGMASTAPLDDVPKTLLIVHDDQRTIDMLKAYLQNLYSVTFCNTSGAATILIRQGYRPSVVIACAGFLVSDPDFVAGIRKYHASVVVALAAPPQDITQAASSGFPEGVYMLINTQWPPPELIQAVRLCFQHCRLTVQTRQMIESKAREEVVLAKVREEVAMARRKLGQETEEVTEDHARMAALFARLLTRFLVPVPAVHDTDHALFTAFIARELAAARQLGPKETAQLVLAALFHDIGKTFLPPAVAGADPSSLAEDSRHFYETHVIEGARILSDTGLPSRAVEIVRQHHEKLDGSGFPGRIKGDQILSEAKILAVANAYHNGVYRLRGGGGLSPEERAARIEATLAELGRCGHEYDAEIVAALGEIAASLHDRAVETFSAGTGIEWAGLFPKA